MKRKRIWKSFDEMSDEEKTQHRSLHGLKLPLWREGGTAWVNSFGKKTWAEQHQLDHEWKKSGMAHEHGVPQDDDAIASHTQALRKAGN